MILAAPDEQTTKAAVTMQPDLPVLVALEALRAHFRGRPFFPLS